MNNHLNLYLTSQDWVEFSGTKKTLEVKKVKINLGSYLLATLDQKIKNITDDTESNQVLITNTLHLISDDLSKRPNRVNVFSVKYSNDRMVCGDCIAKDVGLHTLK